MPRICSEVNYAPQALASPARCGAIAEPGRVFGICSDVSDCRSAAVTSSRYSELGLKMGGGEMAASQFLLFFFKIVCT
jgi:hypothetical protein